MVNLGTDTVDPTDNKTSLREAINYAESLSGPQTITFDPSLDGSTIDLSIDGDDTFGPSALAISTDITIDGSGGGHHHRARCHGRS